MLLVETAAALAAVADLAAVSGVDEIHVGLNDLALSLGLASRWQVLAGDRLLDAARAVHAAGRRFGFGGIGGVLDDALPIPADLIYAEYARVGATAALVARAFPTTGDLGRRGRPRPGPARVLADSRARGPGRGPCRARSSRRRADDLVDRDAAPSRSRSARSGAAGWPRRSRACSPRRIAISSW